MNIERARATVRGAVQGVGFRPFVYRLATEFALNGWVRNSAQGVFIEVEGPGNAVRRFLGSLERCKPPRAIIQSFEFSFLDPAGYETFEILPSTDAGGRSALILPDISTCADCLREMADPADRRYHYPFINCTHCGPRFSIIEALPYDRPNTSMKRFAMCLDCEREYEDPLDRRFHAEPVACPRCGPHLELRDETGNTLSTRDTALRQAAQALRDGRILALKGIGGFQLLVDARNQPAVTRLRERKRREQKPFAIMTPLFDAAREQCEISELEERLLRSPECPIVLLRRAPGNSRLAEGVAPGNPNLGVMLPYTPLHHLLLKELNFPVVATSGNLSDEPICIDEREALERLAGIADLFLVHDRPIVRHVDDSVVRVIRGREMVLRRARGFAPLPVHKETPLPSILAVGAHLKNSVALSVGQDIFVSQHIGDLETSQAYSAFRKVVSDFERLYDVTPDVVACDLHREYLSTKFAAQLPAALYPVQHHWAHVLSCMSENEIDPPVLGVSWDGTGYGLDGSIWGGEFLLAREGDSFERTAHFRTFRLPGGGAAIKQPRRTALGLLFEMWGARAFELENLPLLESFSDTERTLIRQMLEKRVNSPVTSSAGRLFDAVASLLNLRQQVSFEGEAAMDLEFAVDPKTDRSYPFAIGEDSPRIVDWQPMVEEILADLARGRTAGDMAAAFHNTLAEIVVAVAERACTEKVVLTGGCFQNRYLTERCVDLLLAAGFRPVLAPARPAERRRDRPRPAHGRRALPPPGRRRIRNGNRMNLIYGEVIQIFRADGIRMGRIRAGKAMKDIPLELLADAGRGDRVLICDGVAIAKVADPHAESENREQ